MAQRRGKRLLFWKTCRVSYPFDPAAGEKSDQKIPDIQCLSVDKKSGKQITLKNLFKKGSGYIDRISDNIKEQMRAQMKENADVTYFVDDENNKFNFKSISNKTNFYVNEKGKLTLVFDKYEVAPGYMGMVEFSIPTGEIVDMVTNGYLK